MGNNIFLKLGQAQENAYSKALAYFMFREIIEDAHVEYNISQEDIKSMCKKAVNRASAFLHIRDNPDLYKSFAFYGAYTAEWDEPELTDEIAALYEYLEASSK